MSTSDIGRPRLGYDFDRFLRYEEMTRWLHETAATHHDLMTVESYGRSHEGRDLWLVTVTDRRTGTHDVKPAHWIDANIHSVEVTAGVAALDVIHRLVTGYGSDDTVTRALRTRTFYIVPRVNPDGVEWALADSPQYRRSSVRAWPWRDARRAPGLHERDIDGDGRILTMRVPDANGAWMPSSLDPRLLAPVPPDGAPAGVARYRLLAEGDLIDHDGFTVPTPRPPQALDMNRNFPAGWGTNVPGSGDHPLSEPEIDALVRAIVARPNICGYHAYHTSGGVQLRPSSTQPDSALAPGDLWVWKQLGERITALTGYPVHSVYEDFTWDKHETMSGAADDWVYEHLGVYGWTTEFWDIVHAATGAKQSTHFWYTGPSEAEEHAVLRWADEHHPGLYVDWYPFDHPQLGPVELGGWHDFISWTNPPPGARLAQEVAGHADAAVFQALAAPEIEILHTRVTALGGDTWRVEAGIANTGWLPTHISEFAKQKRLVLPLVAELRATGSAGDGGGGGAGAGVSGDGSGSDGDGDGDGDGDRASDRASDRAGTAIEVLGGPARVELGQLAGRSATRFAHRNDGSPDRTLVAWTLRAVPGTTVDVIATHQRAGRKLTTVVLR